MRTKSLCVLAAAAASIATVVVSDARPAAAHGAGHTVINRLVPGEAMAVEFYLSSGESLAGTAFRVFGPGDTAVAYQEGRTDRFGRATFLPDRAGSWRVELADDGGHAGIATVEVGAEHVTPAEPAWRRWLLRISLLANFVAAGLLLHTWLTWRWRAGARPAHGHHHEMHGHDHDHGHEHDHAQGQDGSHTHPHTHQHSHRRHLPVGAVGGDAAARG